MAANQNITTNFQVTTEWTQGFTGEIQLVNNGDRFDNWEVQFQADFDIEQVWGAEIVSRDGNTYTLRADTNFDQNIFYPGGSRTITFNANKNSDTVEAPSNFLVGDNLTENISEAIENNFESELNNETITDNFIEEIDNSLEFENTIEDIDPENVEESNNNVELDDSVEDIDNSWESEVEPDNTIEDINPENIEDIEPELNDTISEENILEEVENIIEETGETVTEDTNTTDIVDDGGITNPQTGSGQFRYGEALQKSFLFYEANRSGELPEDNRVEWRGDSATDDGSDVGLDLTGGYYDAGDHVKFGLPMSATSTMLAWGGVEYGDAYKQAGQYDELLKAVKWATDYFLKAHITENGKTKEFYAQVGDGDADHAVWIAPEDLNMERPAFKVDAANPGSDVAAGTASALASASMLFRGVDDAYADELLKNAEQLFEFADTYRGKYSDSIPEANPFYTSFSGYADELAEGAMWLYKATGKQEYLTRAEDIFDNEVGYPSDWTWMTDNKSNAAALLLAQESSDPKYQQMTEQWLDSWVEGTGNVSYSPGGMAFRYTWGSLALSSSAAFLAELYNDTVKEDSRYSDFANNQIDYVLGDNPANFSYMIGFGDNYSQQPHHRSSTGDANYGEANEHILYGALVGGPGSTDDFDYNDDRNDWITNEVATPYNAPLTSALIQQYDDFGGDPLTDAQLDDLVGVDVDGI